jgi:hypothetical protein
MTQTLANLATDLERTRTTAHERNFAKTYAVSALIHPSDIVVNDTALGISMPPGAVMAGPDVTFKAGTGRLDATQPVAVVLSTPDRTSVKCALVGLSGTIKRMSWSGSQWTEE